jgi:DNA sulfur modification protein DndD
VTLDKLVVENFGAYRGRHTIKLTPPSRKRPIVLFGGLNGAGKTTLLDALQLVLYGKRARCSNRGSLGYDEFLRQSMNRNADPNGGASIELCFHQVNDGQEQSYRVVRHWHANGNGMKETVDVAVDGVHDATVAESWAEYAEEFVPSRLSHLFFFDGEKIETLADLANAADVLRTGIHSLLGLDLVDRLHDDLDVVAGRKEKLLNVDDGTSVALHSAEAEVRELRSRRDELIQAIAGVQSQLDQCAYRLEKVIEKLHTEGGELFAQKDLLENNRAALISDLDGVDSALREVASGSAPLLLVGDLLAGAQEQSRNEKASVQAGLLDDILRERDALVLETIIGLGTSTTVQETLAAFLAMDRRERTATRDLPRYLQLSDEAASLLQDLSTVTLPSTQQKITMLLARHKDLAHALISVERKLSTVPEEDAIAPFERERVELTTKQSALADSMARLKDERQRVDHELSRKEGTLKRLQEEAARVALEQEDLSRMMEHARRSQRTLCMFREHIVERHLSRIEASVTESFRHLLRKQALVSSLRIDPRTYALELRDADGMVLRPERLSAGERQLLAVSLVWGLAKASRRPLPAVIDTPLGRLDSSHRRHLVQRYFPQASHQVLLLSTDEEIRGEYFESLRPSIGHAYLLQYDEKARTSTVQAGYFPKENGHAA